MKRRVNVYMKQAIFLFTILITILAFTSCGNKATPSQPAKNTTPETTVTSLGIPTEEFKNRWNGLATMGDAQNLKIKDAPGTGGTDKTTYTFSKNITMTVNVLKDQGKVQDLSVKANSYKMDETESNTMGGIYYLIIQTAEPEMTEEELNSLLDELGKDVKVGYNKTVVKRNTSFQLKVNYIGTMELIVKNKNAK